MALTESIEYDKIEVLEYAIQVRKATVIQKDGKELTRSFHRYTLTPDSDISNEPAKVQAVCNAVWTDAIKTAWTEFQKTVEKPIGA